MPVYGRGATKVSENTSASPTLVNLRNRSREEVAVDPPSMWSVRERRNFRDAISVHTGMYAPHQREGLAGALAIHLLLYCGIGACFGFGLYELLQPARVGNPGLAMYKPPPRTVLGMDRHLCRRPPNPRPFPRRRLPCPWQNRRLLDTQFPNRR